MTTTTSKYRVIDAPSNGTTGQDCGTFTYDELPPHLQAAIDAAPDSDEWTLPALSDGDSGDELSELSTIVRRA